MKFEFMSLAFVVTSDSNIGKS